MTTIQKLKHIPTEAGIYIWQLNEFKRFELISVRINLFGEVEYHEGEKRVDRLRVEYGQWWGPVQLEVVK